MTTATALTALATTLAANDFTPAGAMNIARLVRVGVDALAALGHRDEAIAAQVPALAAYAVQFLAAR